MKKSVALMAMAVALAAMVFAGCGKSEDEGTKPAGAKPTPAQPDVKDDGAAGAVTETEGGIPKVEHKGTVIEGGLIVLPPNKMVFAGILGGKLIATMRPAKGWQKFQGSKTDCSILALEGGKALVDGKIEHRVGVSLFLAPGSTLKNATTSGEAIAIPRPNGGPAFGLAHGETIRITPTGGIERIK